MREKEEERIINQLGEKSRVFIYNIYSIIFVLIKFKDPKGKLITNFKLIWKGKKFWIFGRIK